MRLFFKKSEKDSSSDVTGRRKLIQRSDTSANAYFYHSNRTIDTEATKRQTLRHAFEPKKVSHLLSYSIERFGLLIVIIVAAISLFNIMSVSPNSKVVLLNQNQIGYLHTAADYQKAVNKLLSNTFTNNNKITINTNGISAALEQQFPELSDVTIKIPLIGRNIIIYLTPNKVILALSTNNGAIYAIDANGQVLGQINSTYVNTHQLTTVQDSSNTSVKVGQLLLSSDSVSFMQTVLFQVEQKQLTISKLVMPAGENELDLYLAGRSYFIKFNLDDNNPLQEVGTFLAVQHNLQEKGITPSQYIDVRVDGRAYYK